MDWTIRKYAVHLQMDGPFINGLNSRLDCINFFYKIMWSLYIKGATARSVSSQQQRLFSDNEER